MEKHKRAYYRRQQRQTNKIMEKKPTDEAILMEKAFMAGRREGFDLGIGLILLALHEGYGFGTKRLMGLLDIVDIENRKMDEDATRFNVEWYIEQLHKKCNMDLGR